MSVNPRLNAASVAYLRVKAQKDWWEAEASRTASERAHQEFLIWATLTYQRRADVLSAVNGEARPS